MLANVYKIAQPVTELPAADALGEPFATFAVANLDIQAGDFAGGFQGADAPVKEWFAVHYRGSLNVTEAEDRLIARALEQTNGNRTRAAELLGMSVRTLRNKLNVPIA